LRMDSPRTFARLRGRFGEPEAVTLCDGDVGEECRPKPDVERAS
jgi:hypothetical protein